MGFLWGNGYRAIIHHASLCPSPSGTLPRQQSISAAIHHRPERGWEGERSDALRPSTSGAPTKALMLLSCKHLSDIKLGQLSCRSQAAIKVLALHLSVKCLKSNSLRKRICLTQKRNHRSFKYISPAPLKVSTELSCCVSMLIASGYIKRNVDCVFYFPALITTPHYSILNLLVQYSVKVLISSI